MDTRDVTERIENLIDNCEKAGHGKKFFVDAVCAIFAEERAALVELQHIDEVLARRPALADCKTRIEKIELAISTAKRAEAAEARDAKLREALDSLLSAIEDWHGSQRGEYCDEMCDRLHMAMDKADDALAKEGK